MQTLLYTYGLDTLTCVLGALKKFLCYKPSGLVAPKITKMQALQGHALTVVVV